MVRSFFGLFLFLLLAGCAVAPGGKQKNEFAPVQGETVLYVVPFLTIMTPVEIEEGIFDQFIESLNAQGAALRYEFVILKEGLDRVDRAWLGQQHYVTGEVFGYIEESGCCSTSIRAKSRIRLFAPDNDIAVLEIDYPRESFFEHDMSTIETERQKLALAIADHLATGLLHSISPP